MNKPETDPLFMPVIGVLRNLYQYYAIEILHTNRKLEVVIVLQTDSRPYPVDMLQCYIRLKR